MHIARLFLRSEDGHLDPFSTGEQCPRRGITAVRVLLFLLFLGQMLAFAGIYGEDCFITFRYARNLAEGRGLVYNPGEYVEGISNPYWALCNAALYVLGVPKGLACTLLIFLHAVAGWWVFAWAARIWLGRGSWFSLLPLLFLSCLTMMPAMFQNGLEGSASFLGVSLLCTGIVLERPAVLTAGVSLLLGNRPEAPAFAALAVLWLGWEVLSRRLSWRRGLVWAGGIVGMVAVMVAARWAYYGDIVPNTLRAKGSTPIWVAFRPGLVYVWEYARVIGPWMPLLAALTLLDGKRRARSFFLLLVVGGNAAVVVRNAGDGMTDYRLLTPYYGIIALLAASGFVLLWRRGRPALRTACAAAFLLGALLSLQPARLRDAVRELPTRWVSMETWEEKGVFHLDSHVTEALLSQEPDDVVVVENGGWPPFRMKAVRAIELFSLADRELVISDSPCVRRSPTGGVINWHGILAGRRPAYFLFATGFLHDKLLDVARCPETAPLLGRYVAAQNMEADPFGVFLVRDDRAALEQFIRDYGYFFPASDIVAVLQEDGGSPSVLPRDNAKGPWALPPWRAENGGEGPVEAWQQWDGNQRLRFCARIPLHEGLNRFTRPLPADGAPLLVTLDLPPGQNGLEIGCRRSGGGAPWTLKTDDSPLPDGQYRCHYAFLPECPPVEDEILTLEIASRGAAEVLVGVGRWCRGSPPALPAPHVYPDVTDHRGDISRFRNPKGPAEALSRAYMDAGDLEGLVSEWRSLVAARPGCPMRGYFLACALVASGQHAGALAEFRRVRDLEHWGLRLPEKTPLETALKKAVTGFFAGLGIPDYSYAAGALAGEARVREETGQLDAAVRIHEALLRDGVCSHESCEALDRIHMARGDLPGLVHYWERLLEESPDCGFAWLWLGLACERVQDWDGAARALRRSMDLSTQGEAESARGTLLRVLCSQAESALAGGRTDEARRPLEEARSLAPQAPCVLLAEARFLELLGDTEAAVAGYRACVESLPEAYDAYSALDRIYAARGDVAALERLWAEMVSRHPERRQAWFCLGLARERGQEYDGAVSAYERSLDLCPEGASDAVVAALARACAARGRQLLEQDHAEAARAFLGRALELDGGNVSAQWGMARLAELRGDVEGADIGYRACVEADPERYEAYAALDKMWAARGGVSALETFWSGVTLAHPERRHAWFCLGLARERGHRYREAVQAYEEALRRAPPGQEAPPREAMDRARRAGEAAGH